MNLVSARMSSMADRMAAFAGTRSPLIRLAYASAIVLGLFWLVLIPNFLSRDSLPINTLPVGDLSIASVNASDRSALEAAEFRPYDGDRNLLAPGYYAVRTQFTIDTVPERGVGLILYGGGDNARSFINGEPLTFEGSMDVSRPSYHQFIPSVEQVSPAFLKPGVNQIDTIHVLGEPARRVKFWPPDIGEYNHVIEVTQWRLFLLDEFLVISIIVGLVLAVFIGVILPRTNDKRMLFWLMLLCISWSAHGLIHRWAEIPIDGQARGAVYSLLLFLMSACWPIFVDMWSERPSRWFRYLILFTLGVASVTSLYFVFASESAEGWVNNEKLMDRFGLAMTTVTFLRLLWHFLRVHDEDRHWEAAILILLASLLAVFLFNLMIYDRNLPYLRLGQPIILLAFAVMFFSRNFQLFRSTAQINALLKDQLDEKTAALDLAYLREKDLVRQQAHDEERRRLMRDMHDGLGSHLMALLVMARRGKGEPQDFAEGIQQVIDEMRLMIESLDSVGDSLEIALESFGKMMSARIGAAGFKLDWRDEMIGAAFPDYDARTILQVFRILQEAVTNALKHSGGDRIWVRVGPAADSDFAIEIEVGDNGSGTKLSPHRPGGHGLRNMEVRAASIDGKLDFAGGQEGMRVILQLKQDTTADRREK